MSQYFQGIFTVLSLVNPMICATMFLRGRETAAWNVKAADATKAMLAVMTVLIAAALCGAQLLKTFGISLPAFQTAGGIVLAGMGFIMLRGNASPTTSAERGSQGASLTPLILFAASPGTITGVITLSVAHAKFEVPVTALVAVVVALTITWAILLLVSRGSGSQEHGLVHDVGSRFMGLIVLAMGVQFALEGLRDFYDK